MINLSGQKVACTQEYLHVCHLYQEFHRNTYCFLATATYLINWLVNGDGKDLLDHLNFHILPMANPDGYEYSRDHVSCFHERNSFDFIN